MLRQTSQQIAYIGCVSSEERCAQIGVSPQYSRYASLETNTYRAALVARQGVPPAGVTLRREPQGHDFGNYLELIARYDDSNAVACAYVAAIEQGLRRWSDAGFQPPVLYDDGSQARETHYVDHFEAVRCVTLALERKRIDGTATLAQTRMIANVRTAYPREAGDVDRLLHQIATERAVRAERDRRIGLYAPLSTGLYAGRLQRSCRCDFTGRLDITGDVIDIEAHEFRLGYRHHIICPLGSARTLDDALETCWEHLARYGIA